MVGTVTARVSVLPVVGSELPTVFDAAVVDAVCMVDGLGNTLDAVDEGVGRSCVRIWIQRSLGLVYMTCIVSCVFGLACGRSD